MRRCRLPAAPLLSTRYLSVKCRGTTGEKWILFKIEVKSAGSSPYFAYRLLPCGSKYVNGACSAAHSPTVGYLNNTRVCVLVVDCQVPKLRRKEKQKQLNRGPKIEPLGLTRITARKPSFHEVRRVRFSLRHSVSVCDRKTIPTQSNSPNMLSILRPYSSMGPLLPLSLLFLSIFTYSLALHFRRLQWPLLAPLLFLDYLALATLDRWPGGGLDFLWGLLICIWVSHSLSVLFLEDHTFIVDGKGVFQDQSWWCKLWTTWNNCRLLGTSRAEPRYRPDALSKIQSRWRFSLYRIGKLLLYLAYNDFVQPRLFPGAFAPLRMHDFGPVQQTFLRRLFLEPDNPITMREVRLRAVMAVHWAGSAIVLVDGVHTALSLLFVAVLRANQPAEWPPIYGDIRKAYTLRGLWGDFWHRLVVIPYSNVGNLLARRCFGLSPRSLAGKLVVAGTVFGLSGIVHAVVAIHMGDEQWWYLDIVWFMLNFAACTVEGFVCAKFARWKGCTRNGRALKCLGFLWVYLFLFWSVPKWQYAKTHSKMSDFPFFFM